jgi:hypothetical protein
LTATLLALLSCASISLGAAAGAQAAVIGGHGVAPWPYHTLQLGVLSPAGQAAAETAQAPIGFRYAYLSGGANTADGWSTWANGHGSYVSEYIAESEAADVVPVFSYYQLRQSQPGAGNGEESAGDLENLANRSTMRAWYEDLKLFFAQAASATGPVVLQVEPDLWGYIEAASKHNDASSVHVAVASSGMPDLKGMPNTATGLAQAILVLRNNYAPKVIVAYHDSSWGTGLNIQSSHPTRAQVQGMAERSVAFYRSLDARFNALFTETSNADAGYAQEDEGAGTTQWWAPIDFTHLGEYIRAVHHALRLPVVIWQIPVGTTFMKNTYQQFEDNKLQSLLDTGPVARTRLHHYANDGVAALLFGPAQSSDTQVSRVTLRFIARYYGLGPLRIG